MSFRRCLSVLALIAVALNLGCSKDTSDVTTVMLWHQMRPGGRGALLEEIERFEAAHPDIRIKELYKENEELRSGFEAAALAGMGPDLIFGPSDTIQVYQTMGIVADLGQYFAEEELADFLPSSLTRLPSNTSAGANELLQIGDRVGNHVALVYNRNLLPNPPRDSDELIEFAKQMTSDDNGDGNTDTYGLVWNYSEPFFSIPFITGYGGWIFDENDPTLPTLDTPEIIRAFQLIVDLRDEHRVVPLSCTYDLADALFKDGKAAMIINGDWSWREYLEVESIDAAVVPLPTISSTGLPMGPMVASKGYSLNINSNEQQAAAAAEFVRFMTSTEVQQRMSDKVKTLPSRRSLLDDPRLLEDSTLRASAEQMRRGRPMPAVAEMRAVWDAMRPHYQAILGGTLSPEEAAAEMQKEADSMIEKLNRDLRPGPWAPIIQGLMWLSLLGVVVWQWPQLRALVADLPRNRMAYACTFPALLILFLTVVFPFAFNVVLSFSNMSMKHFQEWQIVGLHNYAEIAQEPDFLAVLWKTVIWTFVNVFFHVLIGVFLAVMLNGPIRGKRIYRLLLIIPWAVPAYITALTWQGMFDFKYGAINLMLGRMGFAEVNWLGEPTTAFLACMITNIWLGVPFMMIIALGGMQSIPVELYEAAKIDRASRWHQFWHITVPMLRPVLLPATTLGVIWTFNKLDIVWLVSEGGKPEDQTHILVSYVYRSVFNLYRYGYGAALSLVIFAILFFFSLVFLKRTDAAQSVH